jgi:hypothetical protein
MKGVLWIKYAACYDVFRVPALCGLLAVYMSLLLTAPTHAEYECV